MGLERAGQVIVNKALLALRKFYEEAVIDMRLKPEQPPCI